MGNRRLPNNIHKIRGTLKKCRHGSNLVIDDSERVKPEYPNMPEHVETYPGASKIWNEVREAMIGANVYSTADANKLARYCILEACFRTDPVGFTEKPSRLTQLRLLENDLYLSPESRAKVGGKKDKVANSFTGF